MKISSSVVAIVVVMMGTDASAQLPSTVPPLANPAVITDDLIRWTIQNGALPTRAYDLLTPRDADYEPKFPPPSGPGLPARCAGPEANVCRDCGFERAIADLQSTRYRLEKLRRVFASSKQMLNASLAAGDSMAGAAGIGGLAWVSERNKILKSFQGVERAYDAKYEELMGLLEKSLRELAACEELVFGEENWYERFGFIYYESMRGLYARPS